MENQPIAGYALAEDWLLVEKTDEKMDLMEICLLIEVCHPFVYFFPQMFPKIFKPSVT